MADVAIVAINLEVSSEMPASTPTTIHQIGSSVTKQDSSLIFHLFLGFSYYATTTSLSTGFYLALLDRGWRRSGTTLYKPDLLSSCCPHYTIRLDSHAYHASKTQRQTLNRFNKHIIGDSYTKEAARLYPKSREEAKKRDTDFDLVKRVHEPEYKNLKPPLEPEHRLTITLETDEFTEEKYLLYAEYQKTIHKDPPSKISRQGFKSFLCTSPLKRIVQTTDGQKQKLGCKLSLLTLMCLIHIIKGRS